MTQIDFSRLDSESNGGAASLNRVTNLVSSGYGWIPTQTLYAFADSGLSDDDIGQTVKKMTQSAIRSDQQTAINRQLKKVGQKPAGASSFGFKQFFDDPVLQKAPSVGLALKQYLSGSIGAWPIGEQDIAYQQQQLQVRGYGRDLPIDGVWKDDAGLWDAAFRQYSNDLYKSQIAGDKSGSLSLKTVLKGLEALQPTNAFNSIIGFVGSLDNSFRDLLANVAGGAVQLGHSVLNPDDAGSKQKLIDVNAATRSDVKNFLGGPTTTPGHEAEGFEDKMFAGLVQDLSTIFLLTSAFGAAGRFAKAIGGEAGLSAEVSGKLAFQEAVKGPGVIADSFNTAVNPVRARVTRTALGATLGASTVAATGTDDIKDIMLGAAVGGAFGAYTTTNAFKNMPVLGHTGGEINTLLGGEGYYYKTRSFLARPYRYAPVRVAGSGFQEATFLGAKADLSAKLQEELGGTDQSRAILGEHVLDTVNNAASLRLPLLGDVGWVDGLQFFLHGPREKFIRGTEIKDEFGRAITGTAIKVPEAQLSTAIGRNFEAVRELFDRSLGEAGWAAAWERISGMTWAENIKHFGGEERLLKFVNHKINTQAAWMEAERVASGRRFEEGLDPPGFSDEVYNEEVAALRLEIMADPEKLGQAVRTLKAQGNGRSMQQFIDRTRKEIAINSSGPKASEYQDGATFMDAVDLVGTRLHHRLQDTLEDGQRIFGNVSDEAGAVGIARNGSFTEQEALHRIAALRKESDVIRQRAADQAADISGAGHGHIEEAMADWEDRMDDLLVTELGINPLRIPHAGPEKLEAAENAARHLAGDVKVHPDVINPASPLYDPEIAEALQDLDRLGYKLVAGQGVGHIINGPGLLDEISGSLSMRRRIVERLGLNPVSIDPRSIYSTRITNAINSVNEAMDAGKIQVNDPLFDADVLVQSILKKGFIPHDPGYFRRIAESVFRSRERLAKANDIDLADKGAKEFLDGELYQYLTPPDIPRKKFIEAFTNPRRLENLSTNTMTRLNRREFRDLGEQGADIERFYTSDVPLMSEESAQNLYTAVRKGFYSTPTYMLGAQRVEEIFRTGVGFLANGKFGSLGYAMANLPNKLIQFRNEFRFQLNPWFSASQVIETNAKMAAEGVPPTFHPLQAMKDAGTLDANQKLLKRIRPEIHSPVMDEAERYLIGQDVLVWYNHRNYEAYMAGELSRKGASDSEIREKIIRVFEYGQGQEVGRTAAERSLNMVFFPFSYQKTIVRNFGSYLLDKPAQRVLLTKALAAYNEFNENHMDNPLAIKFWERHVPLFQEAARLNMFMYGLNLGQPGGINRPLLNLFLPQQWAANQDLGAKLKQFVPVVKNFGRLFDELSSTGTVLTNATQNLWDDMNGIAATVGTPRRSTLAPDAQRDEAFTMQRELLVNYGTILDHNAKTNDPDKKIRFDLDPKWGEWAGEVINRTNLRGIIHNYYPAYDPNSATRAIESQAAFQDYLRGLKGSDLYDDVSLFADNVRKLGNAMSNDRNTTETIAHLSSWLRGKAIALASKDSKFYKVYENNFRRILGPLERVQ